MTADAGRHTVQVVPNCTATIEATKLTSGWKFTRTDDPDYRLWLSFTAVRTMTVLWRTSPLPGGDRTLDGRTVGAKPAAILERHGLATRVDGGWRLTSAGETLETAVREVTGT